METAGNTVHAIDPKTYAITLLCAVELDALGDNLLQGL